MEIKCRNVNSAFYKMMLENEVWHKRKSRVGSVYEIQEPVMTVYKRPWERVLFNETRDANPFFHLMEGLWILDGRNDVEWIAHFCEPLRKYSDDGTTFNGAYGYRMRKWFGYDQLIRTANHLIEDPDSRRAVIQLWDAKHDSSVVSLDKPCNNLIYFKVDSSERLRMTVVCRSNDMIWGAYGTNVVHFSMVHEWMAAMLDRDMGPYTQFSDSFHIYSSRDFYGKNKNIEAMRYTASPTDNKYKSMNFTLVPLVDKPECFNIGEDELGFFMRHDFSNGGTDINKWENKFFPKVAVPMRVTWDHFKAGNRMEALHACDDIIAGDWRAVCMDYILRRTYPWQFTQ